EASAYYDGREYDTVVSSGEQVTSGLLALVLQSIGIKARSWQGWQIPLQTDAAHRSARITGLAVDELKSRVLDGEVAVVAVSAVPVVVLRIVVVLPEVVARHDVVVQVGVGLHDPGVEHRGEVAAVALVLVPGLRAADLLGAPLIVELRVVGI